MFDCKTSLPVIREVYVNLKCEFICCITNSGGMTGANDSHVDAAEVIVFRKASFMLDSNLSNVFNPSKMIFVQARTRASSN